MRAPLAAAAVAVAAAVALGGGCSKEDLSDASFVTGLRVLGVQSVPPEAKPGDTVMLTAWAVDPRGVPVDVAWSACLLPSNGVANAGCTDGTGNGLLVARQRAVAGGGRARDRRGHRRRARRQRRRVPADRGARQRARRGSDRRHLSAARAPARAGAAGLHARFRRGRSAASPTATPAFPASRRSPTATRPSRRTRTRSGRCLAQYVDGSSEEYEIPSSTNPDVFERLTTQWFATAGTFPDQPVGGTAVQKWTLDRALPPAGGTIDLWVVGHDDRGGTAMSHRTFVLQ